MRRLKIDAETLVETINVNTDKPFASQHMVKLDKTIKHESSDEDTGIEHESSTDLDPLESSFSRVSFLLYYRSRFVDIPEAVNFYRETLGLIFGKSRFYLF